MRSARTFVVFFTASAFAFPLAAQTQTKPQANPTLKRPAAAAATTADTKPSETSAASKLPVRRVVLYKTGVGYFEHQGAVRGAARAPAPDPPARGQSLFRTLACHLCSRIRLFPNRDPDKR